MGEFIMFNADVALITYDHAHLNGLNVKFLDYHWGEYDENQKDED